MACQLDYQEKIEKERIFLSASCIETIYYKLKVDYQPNQLHNKYSAHTYFVLGASSLEIKINKIFK